VRRAGDGQQLGAAAIARVEQTLLLKPPQGLLVSFKPERLDIGPVGTADVRPLVPVDAEPAEILQEQPVIVRLATRPVDIFDAENELSAPASRVEPGEESGSGVADVHLAGRRRRETSAVWQRITSRVRVLRRS